MSSVDFHVSKIWILFGKFTVEQVLKSLLSRRNSLEPLVLGFPIVFHFFFFFFFVFFSRHYGFTKYFEILNFALILIS